MKKTKFDKEKSEVTIVIPTFNRSVYVQDAINSALKQTYPCHVVVCDHGSTDDTPQVMEKYKDKVLYVRKEEDFGPHFCWLDGVLHSKTKYVKILYDDDWIDPTFVEKTLSLMREDVSCVFTNAKYSHEIKAKDQPERVSFFFRTGIFPSFIMESALMIFAMVISPTACLFRKEELIDGIYQGKLLKKGGNYYHGVGPDMFVMLLGFLRYKKFGFVNEDLATFRAHEKSITMDAMKEKDSKTKIMKAYTEVVEFYSILRYYKLFKILNMISPFRIFRRVFQINREVIKNLIKKYF
jgi:glycosyltransferase involved in cell wall biosynthesis